MCSEATSLKERATSRAPSFPVFPRQPLSECIHRLGVFPPLPSPALPFTHWSAQRRHDAWGQSVAGLLSKVTQQMLGFHGGSFPPQHAEKWKPSERGEKQGVLMERVMYGQLDCYSHTLPSSTNYPSFDRRRSHYNAAPIKTPTLSHLPQPQPRSTSLLPVVRSWEWNIHEVIWMTKEVKWGRFKEGSVCGTWRQPVIIIVSCFLGATGVKTSPTCQTNSSKEITHCSVLGYRRLWCKVAENLSFNNLNYLPGLRIPNSVRNW